MRSNARWLLGVVSLAIGCTAPSGNDGGSCEDLEPSPPQTVELRLTNARPDPIFVAGGCGSLLRLERIGHQHRFAADTCDLPTCASALEGDCSMACAACIPGVIRIEPGMSYDSSWSGTLFEAEDIAQTCSGLCTSECWREVAAPEGNYRMLAAVFTECPESIDDCSCPPGSSEPCFIEAYNGAVNAQEFAVDFGWPLDGAVEIRVE